LCASYGLFLLGCCDHTYTHYLLITAQPSGKPWKWGLFSCCMDRHWKAATGGSWKFLDNQCSKLRKHFICKELSRLFLKSRCLNLKS
jgi:hypothetical protein